MTRVAGCGQDAARGQGSDLPGHPLRAAIWLAGALKEQGLSRRPGQWLSLGSFTPLRPARALRAYWRVRVHEEARVVAR